MSDDVDEDPTGNKALWDRGVLSGASQKVEIISNFHVGELVMSLQKATLIPGGSEALVYTTLSGGIGMLVPFTSHEVRFEGIATPNFYPMFCFFSAFILYAMKIITLTLTC